MKLKQFCMTLTKVIIEFNITDIYCNKYEYLCIVFETSSSSSEEDMIIRIKYGSMKLIEFSGISCTK